MRRLVVLLASCCSSAPPAEPRAPATSPPAAPTRHALVGYPAVVEPSNIDCEIDGPWGAEQPTQLRLGEGGPVYATAFRTAKARLALAGTAAFLEIDLPGFRFWGHVDRPVLHPARAFVMAGYLVPGSHATLRAVAAKPAGVTVELAPPAFVKPLLTPRDTRACKELGLGYAELVPTSALDRALEPQTYKLPANTPVPLAATPGASPVAELRFDEEASVRLVEQRGDLARVFIHESTDRDASISVVGWVPRALLAETAPSGREGSGAAGGGPPVSSGLSRAKRHVSCPHEVPLVVELGATRQLVGAIQPSTTFGVGDGDGEMVAIVPDRIALQLAPEAHLLVKRSAIADCVDVPR